LRALARPARRWAAGLALAALTFVLVRGAVARAETARAAWGTAVPVLVAARDLRPGDELTADAVRVEDRPVALVAADALTPGDGEGRWFGAAVLAGDAVRQGHLRDAADLGDPARRVVALPRPLGLALAAGDRVDALDAAGETVATDAVVLRLGDEVVEVAVDAAAVGPLGRAVLDGRVVVVRRGG
jgi:hypothetical protein